MEERPALSPIVRILRGTENTAALVVISALALIPFIDSFLRTAFNSGVPSASHYVVNLVLLIAFVGAGITSREKRHIGISALRDLMEKSLAGRRPAVLRWVDTGTAFLSVMVTFALVWSSLSLTMIGFDPTATVGVFPVQLFAAIMPLGFLVMGVRFFLQAPDSRATRIVAGAGIVVGTLIALPSIANILGVISPDAGTFISNLLGVHESIAGAIAFPMIALLVLGAVAGTPIYVVLGGVAYLLFAENGGALEVIPNEGYTMLVSNTVPAIPLFTVAGFLLSESKAGERLIRLFRALVGWLPGGLIIAAVLVSTFLTSFTGASGVTILALGGLLYFILTESGNYKPRFTTGMLTTFGSIGLLFPPSLAIIIYGSVAQVNIFELFLGGIMPGLLMVVVMSIIGVVVSVRQKVQPVPFVAAEAGKSVIESFWELLLPAIIIFGYFTGLTTLVETAALSVVYVFIVEVLIHREIAFRELGSVVLKSVPIIGGVLIILAVANGLSYYFVDAQVPQELGKWVGTHIGSKFLFLLILNFALLLAGMFMDIFSAIIVIVPLVIPLGLLFGVAPVHLGIIFIANMELGFITPPVGLNLFLASYRFEIPLLRLYRNVFPFFLVQLGIVLIITYIPDLTMWLTRIIHLSLK
ncbi:MAG TPA: TRAP transporter large permease subunit [Spirochaetia bacterium]|nr:TRAP transporter large permease subunit [Spirochaetia bacterium]